ncbi:MAG: DinB family protein [Longimicrobiales bacterium]
MTLGVLLAILVSPGFVGAQTSVEIRDRLMGHFGIAMSKFISLAEAMPEEAFTWAPGEGVMEVGQVFMHVARYNYLYPSANLGMELPAGVDMESMESIRDKGQILAALTDSRDWVRETVGALTAGELEAETELYGRTVKGWGVLTQLVSHMSEHLGQSIAYARMNGVTPPWSR